jgi:hypothetical protein
MAALQPLSHISFLHCDGQDVWYLKEFIWLILPVPRLTADVGLILPLVLFHHAAGSSLFTQLPSVDQCLLGVCFLLLGGSCLGLLLWSHASITIGGNHAIALISPSAMMNIHTSTCIADANHSNILPFMIESIMRGINSKATIPGVSTLTLTLRHQMVISQTQGRVWQHHHSWYSSNKASHTQSYWVHRSSSRMQLCFLQMQ